MIITPCRSTDQEGWLRLRQALWPHATTERQLAEMAALLARGGVAFLAAVGEGSAVGFAEAALRHDPVDGCPVSPVAFLRDVSSEVGKTAAWPIHAANDTGAISGSAISLPFVS